MTTKHTRAILSALEPLLHLRGTDMETFLTGLLQAEMQALRGATKPPQAAPAPPEPPKPQPAFLRQPEAPTPEQQELAQLRAAVQRLEAQLASAAPDPLASLHALTLPDDYSPQPYKAPKQPPAPKPAPAHVPDSRLALVRLQDVFPEVVEGEPYDLISPGAPTTTKGPYWISTNAYNNLEALLEEHAALVPTANSDWYQPLEALDVTDSDQRFNRWRSLGYGTVYQPVRPDGPCLVTDEFYDSLFRPANTLLEHTHRIHVLGSLPIDYERKIRPHREGTAPKRGRPVALSKHHRDMLGQESDNNSGIRVHKATSTSPAALDADFIKRLLATTTDEDREMFNLLNLKDPSNA